MRRRPMRPCPKTRPEWPDRWREGASAQSGSGIDYARLGQAVASALGGMTVQMDAQAVGMLVAPTVSRELGRQVKSRQYTT